VLSIVEEPAAIIWVDLDEEGADETDGRGGVAKIPTTPGRQWSSRFSRSIGLFEQIFDSRLRCQRRVGVKYLTRLDPSWVSFAHHLRGEAEPMSLLMTAASLSWSEIGDVSSALCNRLADDCPTALELAQQVSAEAKLGKTISDNIGVIGIGTIITGFTAAWGVAHGWPGKVLAWVAGPLKLRR